jgi:hypothetical protein
MKRSVCKFVAAFIVAGLVFSCIYVHAGGSHTTVRVNLNVSRDWLTYGHIKVKKVTLHWRSSETGMSGLFATTDATFNTDNFEAGLVRYSDASATFYIGRYRDFGISSGADYPYDCTIDYDVITYDADKRPVVKSCCHTQSVSISSGTDFVFNWPHLM